jgi:hypothetical protein
VPVRADLRGSRLALRVDYRARGCATIGQRNWSLRRSPTVVVVADQSQGRLESREGTFTGPLTRLGRSGGFLMVGEQDRDDAVGSGWWFVSGIPRAGPFRNTSSSYRVRCRPLNRRVIRHQ